MKAYPCVTRHKRKFVALAVSLALASAIGVPALHSQQSVAATPSITQQQFPNFADVVETVQPTVVNISTTGHFTKSNASPEEPFGPWFRRFFDRYQQSPFGLPEGQPGSGVGSGFIVDKEGYVVTNLHVVNNAQNITVTLNDGTEHSAKFIGGDEKTDLALLKIDTGSDLPYVEFGSSDDTRAGEWVLAIGNPFGLGGTVTAGIISARGRDIRSGPYDDYLQVDAPINKGNSGGPLFDLNGQVIGVNTAIISPNGGSVGIGFAIPSELAAPIIEDLRDDGLIERGWLGVRIQTVTQPIAESLGLESLSGALVSEVTSDSPAAHAGIEVGDVVVSFDEEAIDSARALTHAVAGVKPDSRVGITVWRDGKQQSMTVEFGGQTTPTTLASANTPVLPLDGPRIGVSIASLSPELRTRFDISDELEGVVIVGVDHQNAVARDVLRAGDVIVRIGSKKVMEPADVSSGVLSAVEAERDSVLLLVDRQENTFFIAIPLV